jgi:hypothetical protein
MIQCHARRSQSGSSVSKHYGSYSGAFPCGYDSFRTGRTGFYRRRNFIPDHAGRGRSGGRSRSDGRSGSTGRANSGGRSLSDGRSGSIGNSASKRFGSYSGAFSCGYDCFLCTRYDAFTRHTGFTITTSVFRFSVRAG